jgi:hypothetical protein
VEKESSGFFVIGAAVIGICMVCSVRNFQDGAEG